MLVLTRQIEQTIVISHPDGEITIMLVSIPKSNRAQLGITAPQSVSIRRGELSEYAR